MRDDIFHHMLEQMNPSENAVRQLRAKIVEADAEGKAGPRRAADPAGRMRRSRYLVTACCAVLAVSIAAGAVYLYESHVSSAGAPSKVVGPSGVPGVSSATASSRPTVLTAAGVPGWYAPKKLSLTTATYTYKSAASAPAGKAAANSQNFAMDAVPSVSEAQAVYIDPQAKRAFVLQNYIKSKAKLPAGVGFLVNAWTPMGTAAAVAAAPGSGRAFFTTYDSAVSGDDYWKYLDTYWMDLSTGTCNKLPADIAKDGWPLLAATADGRYALTANATGDVVYLIDLRDMSRKTLPIQPAPFGYISLSPNDTLICYHDANWNLRFYNIQTGKDTDTGMSIGSQIFDPAYYQNAPIPIRGWGISAAGFFDGSRYYIGEETSPGGTDGQGFLVVDTSTGKRVDSSVAQDTAARYGISYPETGSVLGRVDLFTGEIATLSEGSDVYILDRDSRYFYSYTVDGGFVVCTDIATLRGFQIPVNGAFAAQVSELAKSYEVCPQLQLSTDGTEIYLTFTISEKVTPPPSVSSTPPPQSIPSSEASSIIGSSSQPGRLFYHIP